MDGGVYENSITNMGVVELFEIITLDKNLVNGRVVEIGNKKSFTLKEIIEINLDKFMVRAKTEDGAVICFKIEVHNSKPQVFATVYNLGDD